MPEEQDETAPESDATSRQARSDAVEVRLGPITAEARTSASLTVEVLKRAETELDERERVSARIGVVIAGLAASAAAAIFVTGFLEGVAVYAILPVAASGILAVLTRMLATEVAGAPWPFRSRDRTRPEPKLPDGLTVLRDRLAGERREALLQVQQSGSGAGKE